MTDKTFHPLELAWRVAKTRTLLKMRLDYLEPPGRGSLKGAESGFSPGRTVPCRHERANVRDGLCLRCNGTGWRPRVPALDRIKVSTPTGQQNWKGIYFDEYDNSRRPLGDARGATRAATLPEIDRMLASLARDAAAREGRDDGGLETWERARRDRDRSGDFRKLERSLGELRETHTPLADAVTRCYFMNVPLKPSPALQRKETLACVWLASTMTGPIRIPPWAEQELAEVRKRIIVSLYFEGWTPSKLSRRLGVNITHIKALVDKPIRLAV